MKKQTYEWRKQAHAMALAAAEQPDGYMQLVEQMASGDFMPGCALDQVALLIEIGVHDPNSKLRRQLVADLGEHVADSRARRALEALVHYECDSELVAVAQRALQ